MIVARGHLSVLAFWHLAGSGVPKCLPLEPPRERWTGMAGQGAGRGVVPLWWTGLACVEEAPVG